MTMRLVGKNSRVCMLAIPAMSLPLLAGALFGLRHGAPSRPALAGALAGLLSAGLAATLYASHCTDDSPLFVATWYTIATALVTAIGALRGIEGLALGIAGVTGLSAAGVVPCCMRWKRSTCCAVDGRRAS